MSKKITISILVFIAVGVILIAGCIIAGCIQKPPLFEEKPKRIINITEANISKYVTNETQYLVRGEPIKYTFEEVNQKIRILTGSAIESELSEDAKKNCLKKVYEYIYTFPGYQYDSISGIARTGNVYNKDANVYISIDAHGLSTGVIATEIGKEYGDSHSFELKYNEDTKECELLSYHFFNWIIPKVVYDNAVLLAMEHPVVKKFINDSVSYDLYFIEWFDDYKREERVINKVDFKKPIHGIIILHLRNSEDFDLWVYVDIFNGEVFTEGPTYNPPR